MPFLLSLLALAVFTFATTVYVLAQAFVGWLLKMQAELVQVGYGTTLFQKKIGRCTYRWALVPLGGFTKFRGDDSDDVRAEEMPEWRLRFHEVHPLGRMAVMLVGPVSNILLGIGALLLPIYFADSHLVVGPADGQAIQPSAIPGLSETAGRPTATAQLHLLRDSGGEFLLRTCTLRSLSGWGGVIAYFYTTGVAGTASIQAWLSLVGAMLITLGVGNLLPVPCLNGWKALEILYELVLRRPIPPHISGWLSIAGLLMLVVLALSRWLLLDVLWFIGLFRG